MAQQKITYLANDGKEFKTEAEALAHDHFKAIEHRVEDFIVAQELGKAAAGLVRRLIPLYEIHVKQTFGKDPVAETAEA